MSHKVAVLLSGCGFLDGAEIRESVLTLLALDAQKIDYQIFSINKEQYHTVDHLNQEPNTEKRNMMHESARIARSHVKDIKNLNYNDYDALLLPGGFGVAKNFCNFAFKGSAATVDPAIEKIIQDFYTNKKPIGAMCISPALLALCLGKHGIEITMGQNSEASAEAEKTGAKHFATQVNQAHFDETNKIATTAAYMYDDPNLNDVYQGISLCVNKVIEWC